jgi:protein-tyrosine-phosphatase
MVVRILFLCVHNSCRSQMAEGFARAFGGGLVEAWSAGSAPSGKIDPGAIEAMREVGIDISGHRSKAVSEVPAPVDYVVRMGCGDTCPIAPARTTIDWNIPDPKGGTPEQYRAARDQIAKQVRELIAQIAREHGA